MAEGVSARYFEYHEPLQMELPEWVADESAEDEVDYDDALAGHRARVAERPEAGDDFDEYHDDEEEADEESDGHDEGFNAGLDRARYGGVWEAGAATAGSASDDSSGYGGGD